MLSYALEDLARACSYLTPPLQVELLSYALEDLARACTYRLVLAFGPSVKDVLKDAKQKPAFGLVAEVAALLQGMLESRE